LGGVIRHEFLGTYKYGKCFNCLTNDIDRSGNITIGDYVSISDGVKILTHKHDYRHSRGLRKHIQKVYPIDLTIGDDAFIGENATIVSVNSIGKGVIIGVGSVVTKNIPDFEIWAGNPAIKIGKRQEETSSS
jgi:acetyltransferase-like isoleucine patch superfamily enzyme